MSLVNWNDVYCDLWMQAAKSRGTVTSAGSLPSGAWPTTLPEWPRTTGADVVAIAAVIDQILSTMPLPGVHAVTRLWQAVMIDLEAAAVPSPLHEYAHNRGFWSAALAVTAYLSTLAAPVPSDETRDALEGVLWSPAIEHRNATAPSTRTLAASTHSGMWEALRAELAWSRGSDLRDDEIGGIIEVPRTANVDALQLEAYWTRALVQLQLRVLTGGIPSPEGFEDVQLEWQAVSEDVAHDAVLGRAADSYRGNLELWRATRALAFTLDSLETRPGRYVALGRPSPAVAATPPNGRVAATPTAETQRGADLSSRLNNVVANALNVMTHALNDAGHKLVTTVGRPLLFTGAAVATLLLILKATEPCNCEPEPEPELAPEPSAATALD